MTEEERIQAMFASGAEKWEEQEAKMATAKRVDRPGQYKGKPTNVPDHPPPKGYVCHRCGSIDHWIQACPTNGDPKFDNQPRIKRTTGIPKSFLRVVDKPELLQNDGLVDDTKGPKSYMVNSEGQFVVQVPDQAAWEAFQKKNAMSKEQEAVLEARSKEIADRGLQCPVEKHIFVNPVKTPCCKKTYCTECIENELANNDFVCPNCSTTDVLFEKLEPDADTAKKVKDYEDEQKAEVVAEKGKDGEANPIDKSASPAANGKSVKSSQSDSPKGKKRTADEATDGESGAPGAAAAVAQLTKKQKSQLPNQKASVSVMEQQFFEDMEKLKNNPNMDPSQLPSLGNVNDNNNNVSMPFNPMMAMSGMVGMPNGMVNPMMMMMPPPPSAGWNMNLTGMSMNFPPQQFGGNMGFNPAWNPMMMGMPNNPHNWNAQSNDWQGGNQAWGHHNAHFGNGNIQSNNGMMGAPQRMQTGRVGSGNTSNNNGNNGFPAQERISFSNQQLLQNDDDGAYFRKPVNPHRHQNKAKRVRNPEYREL